MDLIELSLFEIVVAPADDDHLAWPVDADKVELERVLDLNVPAAAPHPEDCAKDGVSGRHRLPALGPGGGGEGIHHYSRNVLLTREAQIINFEL